MVGKLLSTGLRVANETSVLCFVATVGHVDGAMLCDVVCNHRHPFRHQPDRRLRREDGNTNIVDVFVVFERASYSWSLFLRSRKVQQFLFLVVISEITQVSATLDQALIQPQSLPVPEPMFWCASFCLPNRYKTRSQPWRGARNRTPRARPPEHCILLALFGICWLIIGWTIGLSW